VQLIEQDLSQPRFGMNAYGIEKADGRRIVPDLALTDAAVSQVTSRRISMPALRAIACTSSAWSNRSVKRRLVVIVIGWAR